MIILFVSLITLMIVVTLYTNKKEEKEKDQLPINNPIIKKNNVYIQTYIPQENNCSIKEFNIINKKFSTNSALPGALHGSLHGANLGALREDTPAFRGLICNYQKKYYDEFGGSKPFKNIQVQDLSTDQINYGIYGSYRIKKKK
jgi:hypothetical protein